MIGTPGFIGDRLTQAREARGLNGVDLAELVGVSSASLGNYERGKQTPRSDVLDAISKALNVQRELFLCPMPTLSKEGIWPRSLSSATKAMRTKAEARFMWMKELVAYLGEYLDFPRLTIPAIEVPKDPEEITSGFIEDAAMECRRSWGLGVGPIPDVLLVFENNGIIASRGELGTDKLDSFSQFADGFAYVLFNAKDASAVRLRFDAAHELGHLILHRYVDKKKARRNSLFRALENQAHGFALAFLLPANGFTMEMYAPTLDGLHALKGRWKVSIAAMIKRCADLELLNEFETRRSWINLTRRGWKRWEPMDDSIPKEEPRLLRRSISMLIDEGIKTRQQILTDIPLSARDIEDLTSLPKGFMSGVDLQSEAAPRIKGVGMKTENIVSIWDRSKFGKTY